MPFKPEAHSKFTDTGTLSRDAIVRTEKGMAHFAGTANNGLQCKHCEHLKAKNKSGTQRICDKYARMTGDRRKALSGDASACSHFIQDNLPKGFYS